MLSYRVRNMSDNASDFRVSAPVRSVASGSDGKTSAMVYLFQFPVAVGKKTWRIYIPTKAGC